jgi:hypothetical protein
MPKLPVALELETQAQVEVLNSLRTQLRPSAGWLPVTESDLDGLAALSTAC